MSQKNECPQCRSSLDCRSLLLEKILLVLPRPCIFAQLGCKKVLKPNNEAELQHELNCKHGKYPCPFCKTKIVIGQPLNEHVMKKHNYQTESDRNSKKLINVFSFNPMQCVKFSLSVCTKTDNVIFDQYVTLKRHTPYVTK